LEFLFHSSAMTVKDELQPLESEGPSASAAPPHYEALRAALITRRESMPKRLRQLADFALARPEEIAFGTVATIAGHAGVQPSALVRFAQHMGYAGFSELQQIFRARLREGFPDYRDRLRVLRETTADGTHGTALLDGFLGAAALSLERARGSVEAAALDEAVRVLAGAHTIYLLGARRVFPVAAYLAYAFGQLGIRAYLIDHVAQLGPEQLATATDADAVLAISFTPYASTTVELAATASRRGVPVVAITDSAFSPLVSGSRVWLEVAEADYGAFRSLAASFALAMALAVGTAERRSAP
jgi:DNA-binding MurR/RpiR family transcriptional regulator